jgi:cytochrome c peroxidase
MRIRAKWFATGALVIAALIALLLFAERLRETRPAATGIGNSRALQASYEQWKEQGIRSDGDRRLVLALGYSKGLSSQFTNAKGQAQLDLADGSISVEVSGLAMEEAFDVWLVDNRPGPGRSVKPEAGDVMLRLGRLEHREGVATLRVQLDREVVRAFKLDLMVVAPAGQAPGDAGLLFGSPTLFQRLYHSERRGQLAGLKAEERTGIEGLLGSPLHALIPSPAHAQQVDLAALLAALVAEGEAIFFEETFNGNGRTCGTCHPAQNNFTIDPPFIATLPPNNALFVAEFTPALANNFENPVLMRQFGLILENVDGFDDLENKFVMRGVPHTLALPTSLTPGPDGSSRPPDQRTGWGGDGAPGSGTLREFAIGAVRQHFTKTLKRREGKDFRLPTDEELNALEAFQRSLGRQTDVNLSFMTFANLTAENGKGLFISNGCNACHANAGANASFVPANLNFDTGVENGILNSPDRPRDAGFGSNPFPLGGFGDGKFNTPPLVEAADTPPFFHNNLVNTIEDAVAFYNSTAFTGSPSGVQFFGGQPLLSVAGQVTAVAVFLRVLNALENIRSSASLADAATLASNLGQAKKSLRLSMHEIDDAIGVLQGASLHPDAVIVLNAAKTHLSDASEAKNPELRNTLIAVAKGELNSAQALMVTVVTGP